VAVQLGYGVWMFAVVLLWDLRLARPTGVILLSLAALFAWSR
jgi:hypothetical protein